MTIKTCRNIFTRGEEVIAGGVSSPIRAFMGLDVDPMVAREGKGDRIWDVEDKCFIDYCMSWGALLHGHARGEIVRAAMKRVQKGSSFGIATEEEEALAREVVQAVSSIDQVRFVSSGTEAVMTAVRIARGYTGRSLIIKFNGNYHGHSDGFLVKAGSGVAQVGRAASSAGVPDKIVSQTISLPYNDVDAFCRVLKDPNIAKDVAAVVLEPIAANMGVVLASDPFLRCLREETERIGALLIFDEVITGFRVAYGGAEEVLGIRPDLATYGKIVGGGFPAALVGGKKEIMDVLAPQGAVYQAGTLSGNPVAMAAGRASLLLAKKEGFYEELKRKTEILTKPLRGKIKKGCLQETVGMFTLFFGPDRVSAYEDLIELDKERFKRYFRFMWEKGIYLSPSPYEACFISSAHTDAHLKETADAILEFLDREG